MLLCLEWENCDGVITCRAIQVVQSGDDVMMTINCHFDICTYWLISAGALVLWWAYWQYSVSQQVCELITFTLSSTQRCVLVWRNVLVWHLKMPQPAYNCPVHWPCWWSCLKQEVMGKSQIKSQYQIRNLRPNRFKSFGQISNKSEMTSTNHKSFWSKS